jgi:hypothetical protein
MITFTTVYNKLKDNIMAKIFKVIVELCELLITARKDERCGRAVTTGVCESSGQNDPDYGRSIATMAGNLLYSQHDYLAPIPLGQIRFNEALKQNPGGNEICKIKV